MEKIMIVGPVGSGKTTLARQLAKEQGLPFYELDNLIWNRLPEGDQRFTKKESTQKLKNILNRNTWIIEGTTTQPWIKPALMEAEIILLLLPPYHVRVTRIFTRFLKQLIHLEASHYRPSLKLLVNLFIWNHHYEKKNLYELQKLIEQDSTKIKTIKNPQAFSEIKITGV